MLAFARLSVTIVMGVGIGDNFDVNRLAITELLLRPMLTLMVPHSYPSSKIFLSPLSRVN